MTKALTVEHVTGGILLFEDGFLKTAFITSRIEDDGTVVDDLDGFKERLIEDSQREGTIEAEIKQFSEMLNADEAQQMMDEFYENRKVLHVLMEELNVEVG